jgi:hypothetical protein
VNCLTINTPVDFVDPELFPYAMAPALPGANDRVGAAAFMRALTSRPPALALVQNDLAATHAAAAQLTALRQRGSQLPPIVHYFPVDCSVRRDFSGMLLASDVNVTCTSFGQREAVRVSPESQRGPSEPGAERMNARKKPYVNRWLAQLGRFRDALIIRGSQQVTSSAPTATPFGLPIPRAYR